MGIDELRVLDTGSAGVRLSASSGTTGTTRWRRPRVVVAYERNTTTNERMRDAGIEVVTIEGFELGSDAAVRAACRARGSATCRREGGDQDVECQHGRTADTTRSGIAAHVRRSGTCIRPQSAPPRCDHTPPVLASRPC